MADDVLFGPDFLRRLERVRAHFLRGREEQKGDLPAASELGEGLEFHDYRAYSPGDDPRYIDWNAYGRLGRAFLKRFRKEEGPGVVLALDLTASMGFGAPPKSSLAKRLAGGLGVVALGGGAGLRLIGAAGEPRFEGRGALGDFLEALSSAPGGEPAPLPYSLLSIQKEKGRQGVYLFSDLLLPEGNEPLFEILGRLRARGHEVDLVQILAREEREPPLRGAFRLRDSETGEALEAEFGEAEAEAYRRALEDFLAAAARFCRKHGARLHRAKAEEPFDEALLRILGG